MIKRVRAALAAMSVAVVLAGCSGLPPQSVTLSPDAKAPTGNVGKGRAVAFKVVDARADKTIGYRDASGARSAPITAQGDLAKVVGEPAARILGELGFKPVPFKEGAPLSLEIAIKELGYRAEATTVTRKITTKCVLSARVVNGPGHWEGSFPVTHEREMVMSPDENANARLINDVLTESLSLLLSDPEMVQFLARDFIREKPLGQ